MVGDGGDVVTTLAAHLLWALPEVEVRRGGLSEIGTNVMSLSQHR